MVMWRTKQEQELWNTMNMPVLRLGGENLNSNILEDMEVIDSGFENENIRWLERSLVGWTVEYKALQEIASIMNEMIDLLWRSFACLEPWDFLEHSSIVW
ncbi:hypothetical protein GOBAR_AA28789 [Gossypium barbadense]|uniref:Uncharacterized protein n=1 Tax=Gossypium barbadense TaxID=3634 RepID=A0A2P5WLB3_GOSBA|nr:hypothetical protein GOBAR_AA28789 [Gossypium barbadense]